eukprot:12211061-Ditylum_brightwellii.AAC.1
MMKEKTLTSVSKYHSGRTYEVAHLHLSLVAVLLSRRIPMIFLPHQVFAPQPLLPVESFGCIYHRQIQTAS